MQTPNMSVTNTILRIAAYFVSSVNTGPEYSSSKAWTVFVWVRSAFLGLQDLWSQHRQSKRKNQPIKNSIIGMNALVNIVYEMVLPIS